MKANDYVVESSYLYNNTDGHDKIYNVAIRIKGKSYEVVAEYGARTSVLKQIVKYKGTNITTARDIYNDLIREKMLRKGYRVVNADRSGRSTLTNLPVSGQNKSKAELEKLAAEAAKKKADSVYNPDAIPERRIDLDL